MKIKSAFIFSFILMWVAATTSFDPPTENEKAKYSTQNPIEFGAPIGFNDTTDVLLAGLALFNLPTLSNGSCASCHKTKKAGHSEDPFPVGRSGEFDLIMSNISQDESWVIDRQPVRTMGIMASCFNRNSLTSGELGQGGMNKDIPKEILIDFKPENNLPYDGVFLQALVGQGAHFMESLVPISREIKPLDDLLNNAFEKVDNRTLAKLGLSERMLQIAVAIASYEKIFLPNKSNFQKWVNGDGKLRHPEGFRTFQRKCESCHEAPALGLTRRSYKIGESSFEGIHRVTKNPSDWGLIKVPTVYNSEMAKFKFHNSEKKTVYKATVAHTEPHSEQVGGKVLNYPAAVSGVSKKDLREVAKFVKHDLNDKEVDRFSDVDYIRAWKNDGKH